MGETVPIAVEELLGRAKRMRDDGFRLVQIHCVQPSHWELNYSFDKDYRFVTLKLISAERPDLPSISDFFPSAFLYENEIHELYGIAVSGMSIDYKGHLYEGRVAEPYVKRVEGDPSAQGGPQTPAGGPQTPAGGPQTPAGGPQTPAGGPQTPAGGLAPKGGT
jgi:ech hydrogenase subunit D